MAQKEKIAMIGSGNFGSALVRILGANALRHEAFADEVKMYVHEEQIDGENLTDIINRENENVKYLTGAKFTPNVVATPSLEDAVGDATLLAFCLPHQFLKGMLPTITSNVHPNAKGLSAIKGIDFDDNGIVLCSDLISKDIGIDTSILMGANVANQMANDEFCETTIGYNIKENGDLWHLAFNRPEFQVGLVEDTVGVELCGALKNIVAMGAGFCDGMGWGGNSKAAIMRIGLLEMKKFCNTFYDGIQDDTFLESCGVADLITTCYGGRNRLCAEAFARGGKTFDEIEQELLNGQSLQGTLTAKEVHHVLKMKGKLDDFPLFVTIYKISFEGMPVDQLASFAK
jgi:glycerol-3-phosphate dehydrogenase (NAD+)